MLFVSVSATLGALWLVAGCGETAWDLSLERVRRADVIRIGYAVEAPYAFVTAEGLVTGESPEVAREIVRRLGIGRVEWRLTEFGSLIEGLEARRFDVIAAGMFITRERSDRVAFSVPTFQVRSALLVARPNPLRLVDYRGAATNSRARIVVISDSVEERELLQGGIDSERLVRVPDAHSGKAMVRAGKAEALALSAPTVRWMLGAADASSLEGIEGGGTGEMRGGSEPFSLGAFAFRRSDVALREAWDRELRGYIGSEEHRRVVASFGFSSEEIPRAPLVGGPPATPKTK